MLREPVALLLGDVGALHDLCGLQALQAVSVPLPVGYVPKQVADRIFERLPIGSNAIAKPSLFVAVLTPRAVDFSHAAAAFGLPFVRVSTEAALRHYSPTRWLRRSRGSLKRWFLVQLA